MSHRQRSLSVILIALSLSSVLAAVDDDPVADLIKALGDDTALVRKRAAVALQRLGPAARPALPALQKALMDKDPEVRNAAAAALRAIGGPLSRDELIHRLKDRQQPAAVRVAACRELADRFGGEMAVVQALESVLADPPVKLEAAQALDAFDKRRKLERITDGVTLKGHGSAVNCLAFSPDGATLVTGAGEPGKAGEMRFWNTATARERLRLKGHAEMVNAVVFSNDGKRLASASGVYDRKLERWSEGEIKLWDARSGDEVACFHAHSRPVTALAFSSDGKLLVSASEDKTVFVWDVAKCLEVCNWKNLSAPILAAALSPDGKTLAAGCADKMIRLYDMPGGKERQVLKGHAGPVLCLAYSTDGKTLVSGGGLYDREMRAWLSGEAKVWDAATGTERASFKRHTDAVAAVALSPDGQTLATGSGDSTVKLWDIATKQERTTLPAHTSRITALAFSPDGKQLATSSADRTAKLWKVVWEKQ